MSEGSCHLVKRFQVNMSLAGLVDIECKTNTLTILIHQMRISTTQVFLFQYNRKLLFSRKWGWVMIHIRGKLITPTLVI
jgi:hypothetical protein